MPEEGFTHLNEKGEAFMVNVSTKKESFRRALARGKIFMDEDLLSRVREDRIKKGSVLSTARIAAVMAVKKTSNLIPLCHPLPICGITVDFSFHSQDPSLEVRVEVTVVGVTGVEMEALTGVSVALLTVYDMCKALSQKMVMGSIYLLEKEGGKKDYFFSPSRGEEDHGVSGRCHHCE